MQYQYWSKKELPQGQEKWQPFKDGTEVMEGSTKPSRKHEGHLMCSDVFWCVAIKTSFPQVWPTCMINSPLWRFPTSLANFVCSLVTSAQTPPSHKEKGLVTSAQTPTLSRGKRSGDYWVISWLYQVRSIDFEQALITCLHDISLVYAHAWCGTISLACPKLKNVDSTQPRIAQ